VDGVEQMPSCEEAVERAARREKAAERKLAGVVEEMKHGIA